MRTHTSRVCCSHDAQLAQTASLPAVTPWKRGGREAARNAGNSRRHPLVFNGLNADPRFAGKPGFAHRPPFKDRRGGKHAGHAPAAGCPKTSLRPIGTNLQPGMETPKKRKGGERAVPAGWGGEDTSCVLYNGGCSSAYNVFQRCLVGNHPPTFIVPFRSVEISFLSMTEQANVCAPYQALPLHRKEWCRALSIAYLTKADAFSCGLGAYHDQMNDHHLLGRGCGLANLLFEDKGAAGSYRQ